MKAAFIAVLAFAFGVLTRDVAAEFENFECDRTYAKVIADCANGGNFAIGERLIFCDPYDIETLLRSDE